MQLRLTLKCQKYNILQLCRAVLVDGPSFPLLCVARTDLGMPMDAIFGNHPG